MFIKIEVVNTFTRLIDLTCLSLLDRFMCWSSGGVVVTSNKVERTKDLRIYFS